MCLVDETGSTLWSSKVVNDEGAILDAIGQVLGRTAQVSWAVEVTGTSAALLLALLNAHEQSATYVPGRTVNRISTTYARAAKTDAQDAYVIAETVRHRGDLTPVEAPAPVVTELRLLVTHRTDLVADRVRLINRLRDMLNGYFPALERAFDYSTSRAAVVLLTGYQTPAAIRSRGPVRLTTWLTTRKVHGPEHIATTTVEATNAQHTTVPDQDVTASIVTEIAAALLELDQRIHALNTRTRDTVHAHPQAKIIESMPSIGTILGTELAATASDLPRYATAGHLASAAGLAPVPRNSGRRTGNPHRPVRSCRKLRRAFSQSAQTAMMRERPNRDFHLNKHGQSPKHVQTLIALARRRVDLQWALLHDNHVFTPTKPEPRVA